MDVFIITLFTKMVYLIVKKYKNHLIILDNTKFHKSQN